MNLPHEGGRRSTHQDGPPTHQHSDDQTATKQPGAHGNPNADSPGAVEIGFAEHLARIGYDTDTPEGRDGGDGP